LFDQIGEHLTPLGIAASAMSDAPTTVGTHLQVEAARRSRCCGSA